MGPLSTLSLMRGQRKIRRDFRGHADAIREAVENVTLTLEQFADMLMGAGVEGIMWDTYFAGSSNMTREQWRAIEYDCMARLAKRVRDAGGVNLVHSCQSGAYFDLLIESIQPAAISFFHPAFGCDSLAATKERYGDQVALMGAVTPWNAVHGSDLEWDEECRQVIAELGGDSGFVLAPGCFYPANASLGRVKRMVDVAVSHPR